MSLSSVLRGDSPAGAVQHGSRKVPTGRALDSFRPAGGGNCHEKALSYNYYVINEAKDKKGNTVAVESGILLLESLARKWSEDYSAALAPRGFQPFGILGRASWSCPTRTEGEKRLRSARRKP